MIMQVERRAVHHNTSSFAAPFGDSWPIVDVVLAVLDSVLVHTYIPFLSSCDPTTAFAKGAIRGARFLEMF